jgi:hypothetical protein
MVAGAGIVDSSQEIRWTAFTHTAKAHLIHRIISLVAPQRQPRNRGFVDSVDGEDRQSRTETIASLQEALSLRFLLLSRELLARLGSQELAALRRCVVDHPRHVLAALRLRLSVRRR